MPKTIFVNHKNGENFNLTIDDSVTTVANLKQAIADRLKVPVEALTLGTGVKPSLNDDVNLTDYDIRNGSSVSIFITTSIKPYRDAGLARHLTDLLRTLLRQKGRRIIFIGIASYDHGHGKESIHRQQCPGDIFSYCHINDVSLTVILIDTAFVGRGSNQIYDIDRGWKLFQEVDGVRELLKIAEL